MRDVFQSKLGGRHNLSPVTYGSTLASDCMRAYFMIITFFFVHTLYLDARTAVYERHCLSAVFTLLVISERSAW